MKSPLTKAVTLAQLAGQLADRFERIGLDENGVMDPADKRLLDRVRKQIDEVLVSNPASK